MISLLLIISFMLHAVMLIAIYKLFQQLEKIKQDKNEELDSLLHEFMQEIKQENKEIEQLFKTQKCDNSKEQALSEDISIADTNNISPSIQQSKRDEFTYDISSLIHQHTEITEVSEEGKALQLVKEGYTVEEIAKRLKMGVTEVALIIKLQQQLKQNT